jgi:hypothetical protein
MVSHQAVVTLTGGATLFCNPYAAVPSLHVGLAFEVGIDAATGLLVAAVAFATRAVAARPHQQTIAVHRLVPDGAAGGCRP